MAGFTQRPHPGKLQISASSLSLQDALRSSDWSLLSDDAAGSALTVLSSPFHPYLRHKWPRVFPRYEVTVSHRRVYLMSTGITLGCSKGRGRPQALKWCPWPRGGKLAIIDPQPINYSYCVHRDAFVEGLNEAFPHPGQHWAEILSAPKLSLNRHYLFRSG